MLRYTDRSIVILPTGRGAMYLLYPPRKPWIWVTHRTSQNWRKLENIL